MGKELTQEEVKKIQLDILQKVHNFCVSRGLRYSLGGGTLLGAVRHKGYIPWDDDVDIMLPRPDYLIFMNDFKDLDEDLTVQDYHTDKHYYYPFGKIYHNKTRYVQYGYKGGVYIDVFPIDGLPGEEEFPEHLKKHSKLVGVLWQSTKTFIYKENKIVPFLKYIFNKLRNPSRKKIIENLDSFYNEYPFEISKFAGALTGAYGLKEHMPKSIFESYSLLPFENHLFYCISNYDSYLRKHYGNYMELPPKEKQVSPHNNHIYWV